MANPKFVPGEQLIFTRPDGTTEECEMVDKGVVPGCILVRFGKSMDGLHVPVRSLKSDDRYGG